MQQEAKGNTGRQDGRRVICGPEVLKIVLDYGDGPVELDIEGMQLRALKELHTIGLDACAHMLQLVDVFRAIEDGKKVEIQGFSSCEPK